MVARLLDEISANPPKEIVALIKLLGLVAQDGPYRDLLHSVAISLLDFERRKSLLETGYFDKHDFLALLHACGEDGRGTNTSALMPLFRRLIEWGLIVDQSMFGSGSLVSYRWNKARIEWFVNLRIVDNILLGSSYVARKYRGSVPAIYVQKGGDEHTGTGFLAANSGDSKKFVIVTAKHNVDPSEDITFVGLSEPEGRIFKPTNSNWVLHPKLDLALLEVACDDPPPTIFPIGNTSVLTRTITLGYPAIATTDSSYLLAHGGELNAIVKTYHGEDRLIISNVVAPGNSGGPILDEAGLCLGVVVNSFETQHEGGIEKANSAIPAEHILDFIDPYCR